MNYNEFEINAFTNNDIASIPIEAGFCHLDSYYEKPWQDTLDSVAVFDSIYQRDIKQSDIRYTNGFPAKVLTYDEVDKTKYYWDTLHQELYFFDVNPPAFIEGVDDVYRLSHLNDLKENLEDELAVIDENSPNEEPDDNDYTYPGYEEANPWYVPLGVFRGVNGLPPMVVNTHIEFDPDAFYFDTTTDTADVYAWDEDTKWYIVQKVQNLDVDPATEYEYDLDTLDKDIYYYNRVKNEIYAFDYGVYFRKIEYVGAIYEKMFEFYQRLQDNFMDVSDSVRVNHKNYIYVGKHPSKKVTSPVQGKVYYDTSKNRMYVWDNLAWKEITQENVIIPHTIFY